MQMSPRELLRIARKIPAWQILLSGFLLAAVAGYSHIAYYGQAVHGQLAMLAAMRPINAYLEDPHVDPALKRQLMKVQQIRNFAVQELGLPANESYTHYADIGREYVVWNVIATPELSMQPVQWCYPVAGCANYRGYYDKDDALSHARTLQAAGYDVHVAGVPAYSTLGWFSDPVLSTFIHYSEPQLARLVFHELAHQVLFAHGDSEFNESFAMAVEEAGVERWIARYGDESMRQRHLKNESRKKDFLALLEKYQARLQRVYASEASNDEKRARKAEIFRALRDEFQHVRVAWNGYAGYDGWFAQKLTNAHLASIATYHNFVPGFKALLAKQTKLPEFYETVRSLAALPLKLRHEQLTQLGQPEMRSTPVSQPEQGKKLAPVLTETTG
ncbi:aminopeptidase [Noviherbaspirillum sp.]|uniref:aminopeptidase n=1 Tax=Noviherbaspirillum sp. TaxID=1926288 RepID=UPI002FE3FCEC